jgi:hypothetical protein
MRTRKVDNCSTDGASPIGGVACRHQVTSRSLQTLLGQSPDEKSTSHKLSRLARRHLDLARRYDCFTRCSRVTGNSEVISRRSDHAITSCLPTIQELSRGGSKKCREVEQERLAIIRYDDVSVEYIRGLSKRQIIGYLLEVPTVFRLLHPDALEQESLSCHRQTHGSHIPVAWDNFCLPNFKVASLVQVSQQAESEFNVLCEMTVKRSQSLLFAVDPHLALHVVENVSLQGGRLKTRVGFKAQLYQVSVTTRVVE